LLLYSRERYVREVLRQSLTGLYTPLLRQLLAAWRPVRAYVRDIDVRDIRDGRDVRDMYTMYAMYAMYT
jgi:hypothetical protein